MQSPISFLPKSHCSKVTELLQLEAEAIAKVAEQLQAEEVDKAVALMANCRGKVVLSGVGKSGIVARKIAATLTSIGVVAVFLHPSEALHGDLGIVSGDDITIALSNSGETDEVLAMLPCLKQRNVPIIALVGNVRSTLARNADVVLNATIEKEAGHLHLAPTTSTTVAIAIGDALAMTVMELKGLTPEDFALNHPAGRLGKRLTVRVSDLMHGGEDNPTIEPEASWLEAVSQISQGGLGAVNVIDSDRLIGIITDGDLRRAMQKIDPSELAQLQAGHIMTRNPIAVTAEMLAYDALKIMEDRPSQIAVLPVIDKDRRCIGLLRLHDIARSGLL